MTLGLDHPDNRTGGIGVDPATDRIKARDIDNRRDEGDILAAGIGADIAAAHRRDHNLGKANRQFTHGSRYD